VFLVFLVSRIERPKGDLSLRNAHARNRKHVEWSCQLTVVDRMPIVTRGQPEEGQAMQEDG